MLTRERGKSRLLHTLVSSMEETITMAIYNTRTLTTSNIECIIYYILYKVDEHFQRCVKTFEG